MQCFEETPNKWRVIDTVTRKLQALAVCDSLPPSTAIFDYAMGLEKLSANEQFFDHAQMAVGS